ncbi:MAG: complex I subunit 1 family protein [Candidatus Ozemobacteraceae bacterium]
MPLTQIVQILLVLLLVPLFGALVTGVDRKVTARIQGRMGPPILQPIFDVLKLLGKEPIVVNRTQTIYVYLHLGFIMVGTVLLLLGQDMLMALFIFAFGSISLVLGGMCVRSPYSRIGSHREIMQMLAYEPILVILVIGIFMATGSFMAKDITASGRPLLFSLPLIFLAFTMVAAIKLKKSPFDVSTSHHAHQELIKGITIEYAGPYLAMIEIAHWYETAVLFVIFAAFWATNWWIGAAIAVVSFFGEILLDNLVARLTWDWMLRKMWTVGLGLAVTNLVWLYWK